VGKSLIGLYLGRGTFGSAYGAAASLAILLAWVYYAAQILFFGAEITQVYAHRHGSRQSGQKVGAIEATRTIAENRQAAAATSPSFPRRPPVRFPPAAADADEAEADETAANEPEANDGATTSDGADRRGVAVYNTGVALGVAMGRLLRWRRRE